MTFVPLNRDKNADSSPFSAVASRKSASTCGLTGRCDCRVFYVFF